MHKASTKITYIEYKFSLERTLSVNFSMRTNPIITFPSFENATFTNSFLPLNFTVDHAVSEMTYSIDGQESVPISGNTTLTDLANGQHNVTVYATDEYGYTGVSDSLSFNVDAAEFSLPLVVALVIAVASAVACIGVLVFRRKHQQNKQQNSQV